MKPAARVTDPTTHGAPLSPGPGSANVLIGSLPAWRAIIDQHACPATSVSGADGVGSVLMGSPTVFINNQMACRQGDIVVEKPGLAMGPMNQILMECPTVLMGESGAVRGGMGAPSQQTIAAAVDESERPFLPQERPIAHLLAAEGKTVKALKEGGAGRSPDALVDGQPTEFKTLDPGATSATVRNVINNSIKRGGQARSIIIDAKGSGLT